MTYTKPEVLLVGEAALVIKGKDPNVTEDPSFSENSVYDLDE
jgi:hypothetical protein